MTPQNIVIVDIVRAGAWNFGSNTVTTKLDIFNSQEASSLSFIKIAAVGCHRVRRLM